MTGTIAPCSPVEETLSAPYEEEYDLSPMNSSPSEDDEKSKKSALRAVGGAAVVGGVAGLILVGPIVGLAAAGGAAALATTKGKAGDVTRATGEVAASTGSRLKKFDQKHHVTEKATKGFVKSANWLSKKIKPPS